MALLASFIGGLGVVLGAFAAHGLKPLLSVSALESFNTGIRYQMYHAFLLFAAVLSAVFFVKLKPQPSYLFMIAVLPMMYHLKRVLSYEDPKDFDPELKRLALCTFLFATLFSAGQFL